MRREETIAVTDCRERVSTPRGKHSTLEGQEGEGVVPTPTAVGRARPATNRFAIFSRETVTPSGAAPSPTLTAGPICPAAPNVRSNSSNSMTAATSLALSTSKVYAVGFVMEGGSFTSQSP